jgi:hypothetical protein
MLFGLLLGGEAFLVGAPVLAHPAFTGHVMFLSWGTGMVAARLGDWELPVVPPRDRPG